jgi:hypothetical protein
MAKKTVDPEDSMEDELNCSVAQELVRCPNEQSISRIKH